MELKPKKTYLTHTEKSVTVFARVPPEVASVLEAHSKKFGMSKNWLVNEALLHYLRNLDTAKWKGNE